MTDEAPIGPAMTVAALLNVVPQAVEVFVAFRLACVGCPFERFHTLAKVAEIYQLDLNTLLDDLRSCLQRSTQADDSPAESSVP
jgi:hybrid cluster-associated redox disulfide protein